MVAYGKANPGKLALGNSGVGGVAHLTGFVLAKHWGIDWKYVPY
jgi:tripartite-type tricarboxylate transporter receptor subunit TctC